VWALTTKGKETSEINGRKTVTDVRREDRQKARALHLASESIQEDTEQEASVRSVREEIEAELGWKQQVLEALLAMPPEAFERLSQRLLRESGFIQVEVTGRPGDGGIDGKGVLRLGGLINFQVAFQSKRYAGTVSAETVRHFRGAVIGRADKGLIISTGTFSRDARAEAIRDAPPRLIFWMDKS